VHDEPGVDLILVPGDGSTTRTWHFTRRRLRVLKALGAVLVLLLVTMASTWVHVARKARQLDQMEGALARIGAEREQVAELTRDLEAMEIRYAAIRRLFGADSADAISKLWLPLPAAVRTSASGSSSDFRPDAWPLAGRGFVTQTLLTEDEGDHPGVDIAVAADTYVRAAGAGEVVEAGSDDVYGRFLAIDHGQGYRTLYAHASLTFVRPGQTVRKGEVVALSGNTGRSTAPHLHFEIRLEGTPVDPLTMVRPPG
jgi:murein DD-endopeptidase MepM/ murein hydrolase activator NlpD